MRPGGYPEATGDVQSAECKTGYRAKDEGRQLERVAVGADVVECGEDERPEDDGERRRTSLPHGEKRLRQEQQARDQQGEGEQPPAGEAYDRPL